MSKSHRNIRFYLSVCLLLLGCGQSSKDTTNDVAVIDIVQNLGKYQAVPISRFVTELEYIPLETSDHSLIAGESVTPVVTSTHVFVQGSRYCYAFDRKGRFLGQIGRFGQGPGEHHTLTGLFIDEKNQSVYLESSRRLLEYSFDGIFRRSIDSPKDIHESFAQDLILVRDNLFLGHFSNYSGDLLHNFVLFDQTSEVVKLFDNYVQYNRTQTAITWEDTSMKPFRMAGSVYVKEMSNDTIFCLSEKNELVPRFVFDIGKYTSTKERREGYVPATLSTYEEIMIPLDNRPIVGTQDYLFFSFRAENLSGRYSFPEKLVVVIPPGWRSSGIKADVHYLVGIYDVSNQTTQLLDTDPVSHMQGMVNDLDGGLSFWPRHYSSENELVDVWRVEDMKQYLTDAYFAAHEIKDPVAHQKLKDLLQKLKEDDNPVVVIAKMKPDAAMSDN